MTTYESIISRIEGLASANSEGERDVTWTTPSGIVGLSKTPDGRIEIFLTGTPLVATSELVRNSLQHQTWHRREGLPPLEANRLLLPGIKHYDQVAAFLCTELLRTGADQDLDDAFRKTEPIIELAIQRFLISAQVMLGLAGELLVFDALLRQVQDELVEHYVGAWNGWRESLRDFKIGVSGVEVKTTTRSTSSHHVQGTHQVEREDDGLGGHTESEFFLVSIGLQWSQTQENAHSIPRLVNSIIARLESSVRPPVRADVINTFLVHVRDYGSASTVGYDHRTMSEETTFCRPFFVRFVRCYNMSDQNIEVLRSADVTPHRHVDARSVNYRVELPMTASGNLNPTVGLHQAVEILLKSGLE